MNKKRLVLGTFLAATALSMVVSCASIQGQSECATAHANFMVVAAASQQCFMSPKCLLSQEDYIHLNVAKAKVTVLCAKMIPITTEPEAPETLPIEKDKWILPNATPH